jgi:hypothetical protein
MWDHIPYSRKELLYLKTGTIVHIFLEMKYIKNPLAFEQVDIFDRMVLAMHLLLSCRLRSRYIRKNY